LIKVLAEMDRLEKHAKPVLETALGAGTPQQVSSSARMSANSLVIIASELRDFLSSLKPPNSGDASENAENDEEENLTVDAMRRRFEEQSGSSMDAIKSGAASILPMLDPPLHTSIFGFDVQRGCMLSRYRGARQLWVQRPKGGMIDVLHIPAKRAAAADPSQQNSKAVLYCNPNAGLIEVATGMSLAGGNVSEDEDVINDNCWADFYANLGFDVYLFNYAGFGRSYGTTFFGGAKRGGDEPFIPGIWGRIRRICHGTFLSFQVRSPFVVRSVASNVVHLIFLAFRSDPILGQPTPETLRSDGYAVAHHIVSHLRVEELVIHGESIGGVAASGAAKKLTESPFLKDKVALLICDRTFCNLEAVAQRLVGSWSGYAIRALAPFWSTDVAGDFLAANCPKVVANDAADAIIADASSLKSGISFWKEIQRGVASTEGIGWMMDAPLEYRMADWENVCVNGKWVAFQFQMGWFFLFAHTFWASAVDSRYVQPSFSCSRPPIWPADKHITIEEGFHFAACAKRIGKLASSEKKRFVMASRIHAGEKGGALGDSDFGSQAPLFLVWKALGCCDGLCGSALGMAVRGGFDCTVAWLCSTLTFGGQTVVEAAEHRLNLSSLDEVLQPLSRLGQVVDADFDCRPPGYEKLESDAVVHPKPIPEVLAMIKKVMVENTSDEVMQAGKSMLSSDVCDPGHKSYTNKPLGISVNHELAFIVGTLEYVVARLSSPPIVESSWKNRHLQKAGMMMVGSFMNLHCGHNNPFSAPERKRLKTLLLQVSSNAMSA
jgi:hypothetical protein